MYIHIFFLSNFAKLNPSYFIKMLENEKDLIQFYALKSEFTKLYTFNYNGITYVFQSEINRLMMIDAQENIGGLTIYPQTTERSTSYFDTAVLGKNGILYFVSHFIGSIIKYDLNTGESTKSEFQADSTVQKRIAGWFPYDGKIYNIVAGMLMITCPESKTVKFKRPKNHPIGTYMINRLCGDTNGRVYIIVLFYCKTHKIVLYEYDTRTDILKYVSGTDKHGSFLINSNSYFKDGKIHIYGDLKVNHYIEYDIKRDEWSRRNLDEETYVIYNIVDAGYYSYGVKHKNRSEYTIVKFVSDPKDKLFKRIPTAYTDMIIDTIE